MPFQSCSRPRGDPLADMRDNLDIGDKTIIGYLLGESAADEQKLIEERYFSDPGFLDLVLAIEDDLVDAYVRHELSPRDREQFENYFLANPDRRERVGVAAALLSQLEASGLYSPAPAIATPLLKRSFLSFLRREGFVMRLAFAAVLLVTVVGGLWLFIENRRLRAELGQAQLEKTHLQRQEQQLQQQLTARGVRNNELAREQEPEKSAGEDSKQKPALPAPSTSVPVIASYVLTPGLTRDVGETNKLVIPPGAQLVRLQLNLESKGEYVHFHASLERVGAGEIWRHTVQRSRRAASNALSIRLPASIFPGGDYLLTLTGTTATGETEVVGDYPFTVVKRS